MTELRKAPSGGRFPRALHQELQLAGAWQLQPESAARRLTDSVLAELRPVLLITRGPWVSWDTETTQPEYSFWFRDVGWGVENHGTDPNVEVDNAPQDAAAGRDRQLETALSTALQLAAGRKPALPQMQLRPNLAPPPLPPRREG